jgi:hypothetical protein
MQPAARADTVCHVRLLGILNLGLSLIAKRDGAGMQCCSHSPLYQRKGECSWMGVEVRERSTLYQGH